MNKFLNGCLIAVFLLMMSSCDSSSLPSSYSYTGKVVSAGFSSVSGDTEVYFQDGTHLTFYNNIQLQAGKTYILSYSQGMSHLRLDAVKESQ